MHAELRIGDSRIMLNDAVIATHKEDLTREEIEKRQEEFSKQFAQQSGHAHQSKEVPCWR